MPVSRDVGRASVLPGVAFSAPASCVTISLKPCVADPPVLVVPDVQYYFSPAGKRYRSRMEIARDFGLVEGAEPKPSGGKPRNRKSDGGAASIAAAAAAAAAHVPLDRQAALAAASKRREAFALPHKLSCGVLITSLGAVRPGGACELQSLHFCQPAVVETHGLLRTLTWSLESRRSMPRRRDAEPPAVPAPFCFALTSWPLRPLRPPLYPRSLLVC